MSDLDFPSVDYAAWRRRVEQELGDGNLDAALTTELPEGVTTQPLYVEHGASARQPRAPIATSLGWHLCPRYEAADPEAVNRQVGADLAAGATALWLRLDLAARSGVDADDPAASSLTGRDGLAAHHAADLDRALAGVQLDALPLLVDAGSNALPAAAAMLTVVDGRGVDRAAVELHFNCDPVATLAHDGRVPGGFDDLASEAARLVDFCRDGLSSATALTVSDLPYHAAGASASEELGITAATLITYLRSMEKEGCEPHEAAPRILLRAAVGHDVFLSLAKLRALRVLWSKILIACGVAEPPAARIHAVTSDRPLTRRDPWVNMLRVAGQAFAAVTGGADLLTTAAWDRPLGVSTDDARRLSRNTQSILGEESALGRVLDPAGGSHYVERLTDDLGRLGWRMMQEIEAAGGAAATMSSGWLGRRLDGSRAARQAELADGRRAIIGVTHYADDDERLPERDLPTPEAAAERAIDRLREHRTARPEAPDPESDGSGQSLDVWVEMARQGATLGEISVALGRTCCETTPPLPLSRDSEGLE